MEVISSFSESFYFFSNFSCILILQLHITDCKQFCLIAAITTYQTQTSCFFFFRERKGEIRRRIVSFRQSQLLVGPKDLAIDLLQCRHLKLCALFTGRIHFSLVSSTGSIFFPFSFFRSSVYIASIFGFPSSVLDRNVSWLSQTKVEIQPCGYGPIWAWS